MDDHNSTSAQRTTSPAAPRRSRRGFLVVGIGLLLGAAAFWWNGMRDAPPLEHVVVETKALESTAGSATVPAEDSKTASDGTSAQNLIVGVWEQFNKGKRMLTVLEDGTATMDVSLEGAWATIVGEKLEFRIEWEIQGERLLFKMTGGKPAGSLKLLSSIYGNERNHRIEKLTNDQLILVDESDKSRDTWKRVVPTTH